MFCYARALTLKSLLISLLIHPFIHHRLAPPPYAGCGASSPSSLLHTSVNESVRLQERLKRRFLTRHAHSPSSTLEAPANNELTEPTPNWKVRAGEERNKDVDLPDVSPISPLVVHCHINMMAISVPRI